MIAYTNLEQWGPLADDFRAGQVCATIANVNRDSKARRDPFMPRDFMPALDRLMGGLNRDQPVLLDDPEAM
jgi:hypothetical protein